MLRQLQHLRNLGRVVADIADRAAAEPLALCGQDKGLHRQRTVGRRVQEAVQMIVAERLAPHLANAADAAVVAQPDHEDRGVGDPGHRRDQVGDRLLLRLIAHDADGGLLQVRLGAGRERAGEQQIEQVVGNRIFLPTAVRAPVEDAGQRALRRTVGADLRRQAIAMGDEVGEGLGHGA